MNRRQNQSNDQQARNLLVIDDEQNMRHMLTSLLTNSGFKVATAANGEEALKMVSGTPYDFILCDIKMPKMNGLQFLEAAADRISDSTVIMMSAYGSMETALEAIKKGAYDYISKPFKSDEVNLVLKKAEERERLKRENTRLRKTLRTIEERSSFGNMVAKSKVMREMFRFAEKVARFDTTVLITGESGTGKELVARGIHFTGPRSQKPWVAVNCGSIPENLIESELFGHVKGAFTGADRARSGLFREADGGTLFLDEIGELPVSLQVKLLRALQESEVRPVGGTRPIKVNVRVVAATARNLEEEIKQNFFREDLHYRINVMPIRLPPLRERGEDIPLLARLFMEQFSAQLDTVVQSISPAAMSLLLAHAWPGNVRELENVIQRAVVLAEGPELLPEHLPDTLGPNAVNQDIGSLVKGDSLKEARRELEKIMIARVLQKTGGNRSQACRLLEISHPSLLSKMKQYGIS
ncbi:MAG: Type IV fimbriae expression regulatory protein PilR [Olavius algarvensis Delta 4 endosymbiont]|nr:MAG: Type IV fimbriae expression regulatory protein PilR [Olavius algarvensis Delta 4 endosymbiont]